MGLLRNLLRYTLNNVLFGIALMFLIGSYIAIGSGVPAVREYFEMNELEFFDAWPLKVMMVLLCLNLAVVTLNRIPLTPPRYGVWCIHSGIIILVAGMSLYYHLKLEGKTLIPVGHIVNVFYDSAERSLYARALKGEIYGMHPLPSLPRFGNFDDEHDAARLHRKDLRVIDRFDAMPGGLPVDSSGDLASWLGVSKPVTLDIVGFFSYADVAEETLDDPSANEVGVELTPVGKPRIMLRATDPTASHQFFGATELEYRQVSPGSVGAIRDAVNQIFDVTAQLPNEPAEKLRFGIGNIVQVGAGVGSRQTVGEYAHPTGLGGVAQGVNGAYSISVESFNPAFPMSTHEVVQALTLHISPKGGKDFWRVILGGKTLQTDFKMDPATTPPMVKGNRQKEPLDKNLVLMFAVNDPAALLPNASEEKHIFLTSGEGTLIDIHTSFNAATEVTDLSKGGEIQLPGENETVTASVRRRTHFRVVQHVVATPPAKQNKDEGDSGIKQVVMVRVKCGDWSQDVPLPCDLYAGPDPMLLEPMVPWGMGIVQVPGASAALQLQLGFTCRPMPAALNLKKFEMIPYDGGLAGAGGGAGTMFRDFQSTLEITGADGRVETDVASLNSPVYYDHGNWIFFQAGYDPDGQSSTIGVGNRPGVGMMLMGCVMIVGGLLYAFYVKPIVVQRMKAKALEAARKNAAVAV